MPDAAALVRIPEFPKLLLLDTCGSEASVAIAEGHQLLEQRLLPGRGASEELVGAVAEILRGRTWNLRELEAVVVVRGPGSFTGVRVGLSAAKGLCEGSGRPLIAVSRLEVLAQKGSRESIVMLDAGRGEVFWARATAQEVGEQAVATMAWVVDHARTLGVPIVREARQGPEMKDSDVHETSVLTAADALPLALRRLSLGQLDDPLLLDGLYLHKTEQETLARQRTHQIAAVTRISRS